MQSIPLHLLRPSLLYFSSRTFIFLIIHMTINSPVPLPHPQITLLWISTEPYTGNRTRRPAVQLSASYQAEFDLAQAFLHTAHRVVGIVILLKAPKPRRNNIRYTITSEIQSSLMTVWRAECWFFIYFWKLPFLRSSAQQLRVMFRSRRFTEPCGRRRAAICDCQKNNN